MFDCILMVFWANIKDIIVQAFAWSYLFLYIYIYIFSFPFWKLDARFVSSFSLYISACFIDPDKICRLPLSDDPALAMAFSVARRAAAVPLLLVNGTYRKTSNSYLDSSILQYQLQRLNDHGSLKGYLCCKMHICSWK